MPESASEQTILVIDDDNIVRSVMTRMLRNFGYQVLEADGLQQTCQCLDQALQMDREIHLALVDVRVEGNQLDDLLDTLRGRAPSTRLMLTSGYPAADLAAQGVIVDPHEFIAKPFHMEDLRQRVAAALA